MIDTIEPDFTRLETKPIWWGSVFLKWSAVALFALSVLSLIVSYGLEYLGSITLSEIPDDENIYLNTSYMLDEFAWVIIGLGFYAAVLWFLSQIMEKVDQLVWINASVDDRKTIYGKRNKRKNKKRNTT